MEIAQVPKTWRGSLLTVVMFFLSWLGGCVLNQSLETTSVKTGRLEDKVTVLESRLQRLEEVRGSMTERQSPLRPRQNPEPDSVGQPSRTGNDRPAP